MTPHGARAGEDAEDLDVEEVLALVNNSNGSHLPDPAAPGGADSAHASHQPVP
ncbi:molybdopterin molybdenumtransferase MoeA, partial [Streptomyces cahuitamycinicus]